MGNAADDMLTMRERACESARAEERTCFPLYLAEIGEGEEQRIRFVSWDEAVELLSEQLGVTIREFVLLQDLTVRKLTISEAESIATLARKKLGT